MIHKAGHVLELVFYGSNAKFHSLSKNTVAKLPFVNP